MASANKFLDLAGVTYLWAKIKDKFVAKEAGKGLSTNDLTNALKTKIENAGDSSFSGNYADLIGKPGNATATTDGLMVKTDKAKLDSVAASANNYTHPSTHAPSVITQDSSNRFVTDAEKAAWNAKANSTAVSTTVNGLMIAADKVKLDSVSASAQVNVLDSVKVNGTALPITAKSVNVTVPTKVSQVTNDTGFQTSAQVTAAIANAVKDITSFNYSVVTTLPTTGVKGTIYLMLNTGSGNNIYDEYLWIGTKFEKIGTMEIDLSGYLKKVDMVEITNSELDTICV